MNENDKLIEISKKQEEFDEIYNNIMQIKLSIVDANMQFAEAGRGSGKTEWFAKRFVAVGYDMPGEISVLVHKTYIKLLTVIVPQLLKVLTKPLGSLKRPLLRSGIDFVIGEKDLPNHFNKPPYGIENPNHTIVLANGHQYNLVASDQAESIAGASCVHSFIEEMKHNKGERLRSRIFPALRGGPAYIRKSQYYKGITGVSDTARVDLGEDDWFNMYEDKVNKKLINDIVTVAMHLNEALFQIEKLKLKINKTKDPNEISRIQKKISFYQHRIKCWSPSLRLLRQNAVYYLRASTFVNKDFLGLDYFKTQLDALTFEEFMSSIANVRPKRVSDLFFSGWDNKKHTFQDSYIYKSIYEFNLKDTFKLTAEYLKYFDKNKPLILGYDPGHFCSIVAGQEDKTNNILRILKEFFCWIPKQQGELARMIHEFFGPYLKSKKIILYYDRAANKTKVEQDKITTDARLLESELKKYGFKVEMKNEKQRTIYYYEHFKLLEMILSNAYRSAPRLLIDENECPNLVSAINLSPVDRKEGKIALDKSSEKKIAYQHQAALSTQLPSALTYMIFGLYSHILPNEMKKTVDLPPNMVQ